MRNIQISKLKRDTKSIRIDHPFKQSVLQLQLSRLEHAFNQLTLESRQPRRGHLQKAQQLQRCIKKDIVLLLPISSRAISIKFLLLTLQGLIKVKEQSFAIGLTYAKQAEKLIAHEKMPIELAISRLVRFHILTLMNEEKQQSQLLKGISKDIRDHYSVEKKNQAVQKVVEINLAVFLYVVGEMKNTRGGGQIRGVVKEVHALANKYLTPSHKLTINVKQMMEDYASSEQNQVSKYGWKFSKQRSKTHSKGKPHRNHKFKTFAPVNIKEKEIRRIYNCEQVARTTIKTQESQKISIKEEKSYLNSLLKVKKLYKKRRCPTEQSFQIQSSLDNKSQGEHPNLVQVKAREMILKGRLINHQRLMGSRQDSSISRMYSQNIINDLDNVTLKFPLVKDAIQKVDKINNQVNQKGGQQGKGADQCQLI